MCRQVCLQPAVDAGWCAEGVNFVRVLTSAALLLPPLLYRPACSQAAGGVARELCVPAGVWRCGVSVHWAQPQAQQVGTSPQLLWRDVDWVPEPAWGWVRWPLRGNPLQWGTVSQLVRAQARSASELTTCVAARSWALFTAQVAALTGQPTSLPSAVLKGSQPLGILTLEVLLLLCLLAWPGCGCPQHRCMHVGHRPCGHAGLDHFWRLLCQLGDDSQVGCELVSGRGFRGVLWTCRAESPSAHGQPNSFLSSVKGFWAGSRPAAAAASLTLHLDHHIITMPLQLPSAEGSSCKRQQTLLWVQHPTTLPAVLLPLLQGAALAASGVADQARVRGAVHQRVQGPDLGAG